MEIDLSDQRIEHIGDIDIDKKVTKLILYNNLLESLDGIELFPDVSYFDI